ncbi:hypothetical protein D3C73_1161790 [compost metagenome]
MLQVAEVEQAPQFELGDAVVPVVVALAVTAIDRVAISVQCALLAGVAPELAFLVVAGQPQFPTVVQVMFEGGLKHVVVVVDVAIVGFAQEGRARDTAPAIAGRDDATVERRAVAHELAFYQQVRIRVHLPTEGGRDKHSLAGDVIAKAVVVFNGKVDPRQYVALFVQWRVHVQRGAVAVPAAGAGLQGGEGFGLGLLGDDVHRATWIAAAIQTGGRALEHFDALDVGHVRGARVAAVGAETVLVEL